MSDSLTAEEERKDEAENLANKSGKICFVCGDKALGFNFGTMSCESCKAFFRRNATKNKAFTCPFENNCNIDNITRRFCQKCRLQKCFYVGMKKEWILSEEERKRKRQKIEENRVKKVVKRELSPFSSVCLSSKKPEARVSPSTKTQQNLPPDSKNTFSQDSSQRENIGELCQSNSDSPTLIPPSRAGLLSGGPHLGMEVPGSLDTPISPTTQNFTVPTLPNREKQTSRSCNGKYGEKETSRSLEHCHHGVQQETANQNEIVDASQNISVNASQTVQEHAGHHAQVHADSEGSFQDLDASRCLSQCLEREMAGEQKSDFTAEASHQSLLSNLVTPGFSDKQEPSAPQAIDYSLDHSNLDSVVSVAIKAEFHTVTLSHNCSGGAAALNEREQARLHELFIASRSLLEPVDRDEEPMAHFTSEPCLISVINLTDLAIKRIIKMAKQIAPFKHLCQEDQVALLKGGCTELMILRSVMNYNPEKNSWSIPSNASRELSMDVLKEASDLGVNLYEEHKKFVSSFDPRWRSDENIMLLLSAIALFSPDRANVTHRDVIKLEQDSYYYLLRRYLETGLETGCDARRIYLQLIGKLLELHRLNESHIQLFMEVNPRQVEPLLIEIFDLNSHQRNPTRFN